MCDPERHFALIIPQRAAVCPTLLYAIFAVSARHQDRLRYHDSYVADRYQQKCLSHLRGMMFDEVACMDESLLAATVVLRLLEEVEGHLPFPRRQCSLFADLPQYLFRASTYNHTLLAPRP